MKKFFVILGALLTGAIGISVIAPTAAQALLFEN